MVWVVVGAGLAVAALAAIGYYALRVFGAAKGLSKEIGRAAARLTDAAAPIQAGLQQTQAALAARSVSDSSGRR
jgi:hypothetical protein